MVGFWALLIIQVALFVLAELIRPKPDLEDAKPASLGDFRFPTASESRVIPLVWGTVKQAGPNVTWYGDFEQVPIREEVKTSLFSSESVVRGYRYYLGMQLALCRGEVDQLRRVWIGDVEVYTATGIGNVGVAAGGTNYSVGDILTLVGGTAAAAARVRVSSVQAGFSGYGVGVVTRVTLLDSGDYSSFPSSPASTAGGTGTGCTISFSTAAAVEHLDELVIDCPNLFGGDELGNGGVTGTLTFFAGTDDQPASAYLAGPTVFVANPAAGGSGYVVGDILAISGGTFEAAAQVRVATIGGGGAVTGVTVLDPGFYTVFPLSPAATTGGSGTGCTLNITPGSGFTSVGGAAPQYKRTCYLAPSTDPIYLGNSTSIEPWAFELRRIPDPLALGAEATVNGADANLMNVAYEVLTNTEWGLRRPASSIDTASFTAAANTLHAEGNGFSLLIDRPMQALELLNIIQEQADCVIFFDQLAAKWKVVLARGGYDPNTLFLLSESNIIEVESFSRGAWEDTANQVRAKFVDRADGYKETSALAQDAANIEVLQGTVVPVEVDYSGVKVAALANDLAWRSLRNSSYPLAKAAIVADRTAYSVQPGQVVAWTYEIAGEAFVRLPMRVAEIDYGELSDGRIRLSLIQDVFEAATGVFSDPGPTLWEPPGSDLQPFDYRVVLEAPRAIVRRDPLTGGAIQDKLWCAARRRGPEVGFTIVERHAVGSPAGAFAEVGSVYQLLLVGRLQSTLSRGSAVPLTSLIVLTGPDTAAAMEAVLEDSTDTTDLGTNLVNLLLIRSSSGDEFALATSAQIASGNLQLNGVYRGVMDSVQGSHAAGSLVYLLHAGAGLADVPTPAGNNVEVKLLPFSRSDALLDTEVNADSLATVNRVRRPYPPSRLSLDGTAWASTTSMEANGAGPETYAIDLSDFRRRDYRTTDEAAALGVDASSLFTDFPTANTTQHKVDVRNDPAGANTLLFTSPLFNGTQRDVRRIEILQATDGVLPTTLRFDLWARHTHESTGYDSLVPLRHDFSVTTALTGQFNFGALDTNDDSNNYTATVNGTYSFTLSSAFTAGDVEYRLNAGAWTTLIAAGGTSGSILGVVSTDVIEVRHTSSDVGALKQLDMNAPGAGQDAYAILYV